MRMGKFYLLIAGSLNSFYYVLFVIYRLTHQGLHLSLIVRLEAVRIHSYQHASVKFMLTVGHPRQRYLRVKHVFTVTACLNPIIYIHVDDVVFASVHLSVGEVLCKLIGPHAIFVNSVCWFAAIGT